MLLHIYRGLRGECKVRRAYVYFEKSMDVRWMFSLYFNVDNSIWNEDTKSWNDIINQGTRLKIKFDNLFVQDPVLYSTLIVLFPKITISNY